MAESRRGKTASSVLDDSAQKRRDAIFRWTFFLGMVAVVAGMIWLAMFLSGR